MKMMKLLKRGNEKLDNSVLGFSITPVKSCLNCSTCKNSCYALGPYNRYPNCKKSWDYNFELSKTGEFTKHIIDQLSRVRIISAVRIHVAGDFFSQEYINSWVKVAKAYPKYKFYTYTKVMDILDFTELKKLDNVNIINSIAPDGKPNFGDKERVKYLQSIGYKLCPATVKGNDIICGGKHKNSCTLCVTNDKICFNQH